MQAVGDGGQGWGNAILYVFLSPVIRSRLFKEPLEDCFDNVLEKYQNFRKQDKCHQTSVYSQDPGKTSPSPVIVATEAKGYKIQEYNDTNMTSVSTGGSSVGFVSRSDRYGSFRPPLSKTAKLINSQ